ncbi:Tripartite tricarboxylate transporter family receptor [compost metagenome]
MNGWYGVLAPAGTPPNIVDALSRGIAEALAVPALKQQVQGYGYETVGSTPAEFASHIDRELVTWKRAVETSGAKLN